MKPLRAKAKGLGGHKPHDLASGQLASNHDDRDLAKLVLVLPKKEISVNVFLCKNVGEQLT